MLMSFKLLTYEKGKGRNVKFLSTWLSMAVGHLLTYLLTISARILFVTNTKINAILDCSNQILPQ